MEEKQAEMLTKAAAARRVGMCRRTIQTAVQRGELTTTPQKTKGAPAQMVSSADLDAWAAQRGLGILPEVPEHLHALPVSLEIARRLVNHTRQSLEIAIRLGKLRAYPLDLGNGLRYWQVKLGDLANWFSEPARGVRRMRPRSFDARLMAQLEAMVNGEEPPGNESGSTQGTSSRGPRVDEIT